MTILAYDLLMYYKPQQNNIWRPHFYNLIYQPTFHKYMHQINSSKIPTVAPGHCFRISKADNLHQLGLN